MDAGTYAAEQSYIANPSSPCDFHVSRWRSIWDHRHPRCLYGSYYPLSPSLPLLFGSIKPTNYVSRMYRAATYQSQSRMRVSG